MQQHSPKKKTTAFIVCVNFLVIHGQLIGVKQKHFQPYASVNSKREHPPGNRRGFAPIFIPGPRDLCRLDCPGVAREGRTYYQSTKLLVDAAWRHFSATNWYTICWCSLVTRSVSKLGENFKILSMVLKLKLEGMTKEYLDSLPILVLVWFLQNPKISTPINKKSWPDLLKYSPGVGVSLPRGPCFCRKILLRGRAFDHLKKFPRGFARGGMFALGIDWCITSTVPTTGICPFSTDSWKKRHI